MILQFHWYGFLVGLGITSAVLLFEKVAEDQRLSLSLNKLLLWSIVPGIIGARVYHLVTDWSLYSNAPWFELLAVWNGGVGVIGAVIGGVVGLGLFLRFEKKEKEFWKILDIAALCVPVAQAIGRWGNFFNQELYGNATELRIGISIQKEHLLPGLDPNLRYHPLFLYESVLMTLCATLLFILYKKELLGKVGKGKYFAFYAMYYSVVRFLLEFLRVESTRITMGFWDIFTVAQWVMCLVFVGSVMMLMRTDTSGLFIAKRSVTK